MYLIASATVAILFRRVVGDFDTEFFFERHDQLDDVERIGTQIIDEAGVFGDLVRLDAEVFDNDLLNAVCGIAHSCVPSDETGCQATVVLPFRASP